MNFRRITFHKVETGFIESTMMTPMVGMVFLMVMFCIIAMNFETTKAEEREKLSRDMLARPPEVRSEYELTFTFGYDTTAGRKQIDALPTVFYNGRQVEVDQLTADLRQERRVLEAMHGGDVIDKVTVQIRADSTVPMGLVQQLIKKCQDNGFSRFSLKSTVEE